jgi:hypothetical protein
LGGQGRTGSQLRESGGSLVMLWILGAAAIGAALIVTLFVRWLLF